VSALIVPALAVVAVSAAATQKKKREWQLTAFLLISKQLLTVHTAMHSDF
jgi:hypothetical protein